MKYRGGNTNTTGGLMVANEQVFVSPDDRPQADNILILLSDGIPTRWKDELPGYAKIVRDRNIRIIGVGVTDSVSEETFGTIVSDPFDEHYFYVEDFDNLQIIIADLIEQACKTVKPVVAPVTQPPPGGMKKHICDW